MSNNVQIIDEETKTVSLNNDLFFNVSLYKTSFCEEKELVKYIKCVERLVRSSIEYKELITYFRQNLNLNSCTYLTNLDSEKVSIELHHTPYTLFDIISIIISMYEQKNKLFNTFIIANECIKLHYSNLCGLVPLSESIHQLIHSEGGFIVHKSLVLGNVDDFYKKYKDYMNDELKNKYIIWDNYAKNNDAEQNPLNLFDENKFRLQISELESINNLNTNSLLEASNS